jgi:hypothetical protein
MELKIEHVPTLKIWIVLLKGTEGYHGYLHTDGQWRESCVGPDGLTGHWPDEDSAITGLNKWLEALPCYTERFHRHGSRIVKSRKSRLAKSST